MNKSVDNYLINGCERCALGGTPNCKVQRWTRELHLLRDILNDTNLTEDVKWGMPCYTFEGKNILLLAAFKEFCSISFFKGALINDAHKILSKAGGNSHSVRLLKFTSVNDVEKYAEPLEELIKEAIEVEKSGLKVDYSEIKEPIPVELEEKFKEDVSLKKAFNALTRGRQRGYILYFSQAKQAKTRISRIEKYIPKILKGKGLQDVD